MNSVCIATYNGELYIEEQLKSILVQISANDEIIISDDGSTDNTLKIIQYINDKRVKIIDGGYKNFKWNFANAISHAKGDIIFLSDQDDIWIDGKYDACIKTLESVDLVCTNSTVVDNKLNVIIPSFFDYYGSGKGIVKNALNNTYYGSCMAFRKKIVDTAFPLPNTMEIGHDIWIGLVAEIVGTVEFIDTPYLLYRRHDMTYTDISTNLLTRSKRSIIKKIWSRIIVLYHISRFALKYKLCKKN